MTKRTRTILFLACFFLFILIAPSAVLYSQGYRLDLNPPTGGIKFTQTGGLFLKVVPRQADVYVEGKLNKKTDFFFGSALIENLLPKKYKIEAKKEGYHPWEKTLEIREKQVTEAKNIVLVSKDLEFSVLFTGIEKLWASSDQKKIVLLESSAIEKNQDFWSLKLYETEKNIKTHLINEADIYGFGANLINLEFSSDAKRVSLTAEVKEELRYYEIDIDKTPAVLTRKETPVLSPNNEKDAVSELLESFEIFSKEINDFKLSPDSKKLLYFSDHEIWLLFLEDNLPLRRVGDRMLLVRLSEKIKDSSWLNSDYLVFAAGDKVKISEIDDRDRINIVEIKQIKSPEIFWSKVEKKLYLLDSEEKILYLSETLPF